jgi:hypothetical protein
MKPEYISVKYQVMNHRAKVSSSLGLEVPLKENLKMEKFMMVRANCKKAMASG